MAPSVSRNYIKHTEQNHCRHEDTCCVVIIRAYFLACLNFVILLCDTWTPWVGVNEASSNTLLAHKTNRPDFLHLVWCINVHHGMDRYLQKGVPYSYLDDDILPLCPWQFGFRLSFRGAMTLTTTGSVALGPPHHIPFLPCQPSSGFS